MVPPIEQAQTNQERLGEATRAQDLQRIDRHFTREPTMNCAVRYPSPTRGVTSGRRAPLQCMPECRLHQCSHLLVGPPSFGDYRHPFGARLLSHAPSRSVLRRPPTRARSTSASVYRSSPRSAPSVPAWAGTHQQASPTRPIAKRPAFSPSQRPLSRDGTSGATPEQLAKPLCNNEYTRTCSLSRSPLRRAILRAEWPTR